MASFVEKYTLRKLRSTYISTVFSIALVLFMLGLLGYVLIFARNLSDYVKENIGVKVIMKEAVKEADILQFQKYLDAAPQVKSTEYVTKERAAKELQAELGEDFVSFLGYNPLLASVDVRLKSAYANNDSLARMEKQLMKNDIVKEVYYQKSILELVNDNIRRISFGLLVFSLILLAVAVVLINNTIRLSVYSKRFLIRSMQLVGATEFFIRRPFLIKGIIQGVYGALFALLLFGLLFFILSVRLPELLEMVSPASMIILFLIVVICGLLISWASTYLAVRKYLKIKTDDLYI